MNANKAEEQASWLETGEVEEIDLKESATMLRQQQAVLIAEQEHNEMLEAELKAMREQLNANQV